MNVKSLLSVLSQNLDLPLVLKTPDGKLVPQHFHVTEVGEITRNSRDCGGGQRSDVVAFMQVWVANDFDHRLGVQKLHDIVKAGNLSDSLEVFVEHQSGTIALYGIESVIVEGGAVTLQLGNLYTTCLAPDKCGVEESCCGGGCC